MRSPRALALAVATGLAAAAATFAIVMAVDGEDERDGPGRREAPARASASAKGHANGRLLFFQLGCSSCHTLAAAGSGGTVGPNLDARLGAHDAKSLRATILHPPTSGADTSPSCPTTSARA